MNSALALEDKVAALAAATHVMGLRFLEGAHMSPRMGQGLEFESLQPYTAGDDLRHLDWKKLASTDRAFVRRKHPEKKNHWHLIVDRSPSMSFGKKWDYIQLFVGTLCQLFQRWGDSFILAPEGPESLAGVLKFLVEGPQDLRDLGSLLRNDDWPTRSRVIMISDFMMPVTSLRRLPEGSVALQVLDVQEVEFPFTETLEFRDCESAAKMLLPSAQIRKAYRKELAHFQEEWKLFFEPETPFLCVQAEVEPMIKNLESFFEACDEGNARLI